MRRSAGSVEKSQGFRPTPGVGSQSQAQSRPSTIDITFRDENEDEVEDITINWNEIEQLISSTHPFFNLNIKKVADFMEENYLSSNYISARDKHDIEFLIKIGKDDNLNMLSTESKNAIKKRMALFYYVLRFGWRVAINQMLSIEANQLGIPPVKGPIKSSLYSDIQAKQSQTSATQSPKKTKF